MNKELDKKPLCQVIQDFSVPVKHEWLKQCGIDVHNYDTFTDENIECLLKFDKQSKKE